MNYCIMRIEKVKSIGGLTAKYKHNYRQKDVSNADPALMYRNEELVRLKDLKGAPINYVSAFRERTAGKTIRKNAVYAIEVISAFSKGVEIDLEEWKRGNVTWLRETFDRAGDGKPNVVSVVYHGDESNPHCHTMVIPIDDKGHLNASFYIDGIKKLRDLQTSYAQRMKRFGLERGFEKSSARHTDIKKFYTELNKAKADVPKPLERESADEYYNRSLEQLEAAHIALLAEKKKTEEEIRRKIDMERVEAGRRLMLKMKSKKNEFSALCAKTDEAWQTLEETLSSLDVARRQLEYVYERKRKAEEDINLAQKKLANCEDRIAEYEDKFTNYEDYKETTWTHNRLIDKYRDLAETEPEAAHRFFGILDETENDAWNAFHGWKVEEAPEADWIERW